MRKIAWTGTVLLSVLITASAMAQSECSDAFLSGLGAIAKLSVRSIEVSESIRALTQEANQPASYWKARDPRWFKTIRRAARNPARLKVNRRLTEEEALKARLTRQMQMARELESAQLEWNREKLNLRTRFHEQGARLMNWMDARLKSFEDSLAHETSSEEGLQALVEEAAGLEKDLTLLRQPLDSAELTAILRRVTKAEEERMQNKMAVEANRILGRVPQTEVLRQLAEIAEESRLKPHFVLGVFKRIVVEAEISRTEVDDQIIAILTKVALRARMHPGDVASKFFTIRRHGRSSLDDSHLTDLEVAILTDIACEFQLPSLTVTNRFFNLKVWGRARLSRDLFTHLTPPALIALTRLSFADRSRQPRNLIDALAEAHEYGRKTLTEFYLNDLSLALLLTTKAAYRADLAVLNDKFFKVQEGFRNAIQEEDAPDEVYAHLVDFAVAFDLEPMQVIGLVKSANSIAGHNLPIPVLKRALVFAFAIAHSKGKLKLGQVPPFEILRDAILRPHRNAPELLDMLVDTTTQARELSTSDGNVVNGVSLPRGFYAYHDPEEGLKVGYQVNVGLGPGIDLSDASMIFQIDGFTLDLAGDGPGYSP